MITGASVWCHSDATFRRQVFHNKIEWRTGMTVSLISSSIELVLFVPIIFMIKLFKSCTPINF